MIQSSLNKVIILNFFVVLVLFFSNSYYTEIFAQNDTIDIERAEKLIELGNHLGLISYASEILRENPNDVDALFYEGVGFWGYSSDVIRLNPKALENFDKVLEINPNHLGALYYKSKILYQIKNYDEALIFIDMAIEIDPNYEKAKLHRELILTGNNEEPNPQPDITSEAERLARSATFFAQDGNFKEAFLFIDRAVKLEPSNIVVLNDKGWILMKAENHEEALVWFDKSLEVDPNAVYVLNNKGWSLIQLERLEESLVWFDKALEVDPDYTLSLENKVYVLNELGREQLELGNPEEALVWFDKALEVDPNAAYLLNNKGLAFYRLGQVDEAIYYYDMALEIDPDYELAKDNKKFALEALEGTSGIFSGWGELIFELGIGGVIVGGGLLWGYIKKRKKRLRTGKIESSTIMGKQSLCNDPKCEKVRQGIPHPVHYQYTEENLKTVEIAQGEHFLAINHNSNRIYVSNNKSDVVLEIDGLANKVINKIDLKRPRNLAINHETNTLYIVTGDAGIKKRGTGNEITVVDTLSEKIVKTIGVQDGFGDIAVNADTNKIYVTKPKSNEITVIDGFTNEITNHIEVHKHPRSIGINPVSNKIYVGFEGTTKFKIAIIDATKNEMVNTISLRKLSRLPGEIHVNPHTNRIYVPLQNKTDSNNPKLTEIRVIDGDDDSMLGEIKRKVSGVNSLAINRKTKKIYLTDSGEGDLQVLDEDGNLEKTIVGLEGMAEPKVAVNRTINMVYVTSIDKMYILKG